MLKRKAGQDPNDLHYEQSKCSDLKLRRSSCLFYDGTKVRYIHTLKARRRHLLSAIKLRQDNIKFAAVAWRITRIFWTSSIGTLKVET